MRYFNLYEIFRRVCLYAILIAFGCLIWFAASESYFSSTGFSFWAKVGWEVGCYAMVAILYKIRTIPGMGATPVRMYYDE